MFKFQGVVLNKKEMKSKKGVRFGLVSVLDQSEKYSIVRDVADFDNFLMDIPVNTTVEFPVNLNVNVSEKTGRAFLNCVVQAEPVVVEA